MPDSVKVVEAMRGAALPASFIPDFRAMTGQILKAELQPIPGAPELVRSLAMPIGVASNGPADKIRLCLTATGMLDAFKGNIFSAYDIQSWKPDPQLYLHAAKTMGVAPSRCAVVEDSMPGIQAGLAAGMTVFALGQAVPEPQDKRLSARCIPIAALSELKAYLG